MSILVHSCAIPVHSCSFLRIPVPFLRIPVPFLQIPVPFLRIPVPFLRIPVEWVHSCRNQWGMVKHWNGRLVQKHDIEDDQAKKRHLGRYTDQKTEFEWRAFHTYDPSSTYEELKTALIDDYPEAKMAGKGTLENLRKFCKEHQCPHVDNINELKSLTRSFRAEQKFTFEATCIGEQ